MPNIVTQLIREFDKRTDLPIDVNDVVDFMRNRGIQDEIEFVGVDLDPDILLGQIKRFVRRDGVYGEQIFCANIYYHREAPEPWQRIICCKEVLHMSDPKVGWANKPDQIHRQAEKMGLPPGLQDPLKDGISVNFDRVAEYQAMAVLFPWAARQELVRAYREEKLSLDDVARMADIPRPYTSHILSDLWEKSHNALLEL